MPSIKSVLASVAVAGLLGESVARPVPYYWKATRNVKREVPQEHSHEPILTTVRASVASNNPKQLTDPVFALLGNAAAAQGLGTTTDPDCLQQETADQAFTNAKAAGDVDGMVAALQFRALERNTGSVGLASNQCTSVTAKNSEIAAIQQHQDAASDGAAATNKAIVLALAKQIASVGGDPQLALQTGTFAPGKVGDPTGAGNSCDDQNDPKGCIFTQNLLVEDATAAEINDAVKGVSASSSSADDGSDDCSDDTGAAAATTTAAAASASSTGAAASTGNADFGTCDAPQIEGGVGFDGRTEFSFQPVNKQQYNHGSAQNIGIITQFMCDTLVNACGLQQDDAGHVLCQQAETAVGAGANDGSLADKFNAFFGIKTDFANAQGSTSASGNAAATTSGSSSSSGALDFGSCTNPTIEFGGSFDGRTEQAFLPENTDDFNHGSADGIAVLTGFICQQLSDKCGASQAALDACAQGTTAAAAAQDGASADAFNAALGFTTSFANSPVTDGKALGASGATADAGSDSGDATAATSTSPAAAAATTAASSSSGSSSSGNNVQTFTGALGGTPPPVLNVGGDRPFSVNGDTFVGEGAALQRSCSVQHNACADAANAGGASFSVSDCETQEAACDAAAGL